MSILKGFIWSRWSFVPTYPSRARFVRTLTRENGDKDRMNAGTHQEKKMRRRAREKQKKGRKQATNFKAFSLLRLFRGRHDKIMACMGNLRPSVRPTPVLT